MKNIKFIFFILFFPLASFGQGNYTEGIEKIMNILYEKSQIKKDIDNEYKYYVKKFDQETIAFLEIAIPTAVGMTTGKFEIKYVKSF